jgi:hypothetical protein
MNITIRNIDDSLYREIKADASREGITIGTAVNRAIRVWLNRKSTRSISRHSILELDAIDFGEGTENLSEDFEHNLYGD